MMKLNLSNKSNLSQRILTGVAGAAFMIAMIVIGEWTYFLLFGFVCFFALMEFFKLLNSSGIRTNKYYGITIGLIIYVVVFLLERNIIHIRSYYLFFPFFFCMFIIELFLKNEKPFHHIAFTFLGIIYIAFPLSLLNVPAYIEGQYTFKYVLSVIFIIWANDTGAYIAGRSMGKHYLFRRISPKKTWEGSAGGLLMSLMVAILLSRFYTDISLINWMLLSVVIVIFGSFGDLVESLLKRSMDIKDSGGSIPGHGGFLDRFDSLLIAAPFVAAFFKIIF